MKKKILSRALCLVLCNLLFLVNILPQELDPLGPMRFSSPAAPTLKNPTRINLPARIGTGMSPLKLSFLGKVGGVAFDGVAKPERGLTITNIRLNYSSTKSDGNRLSVKLNNKEISAPIYDWQLIPIAKFADDSEHFSCVTLFGKLEDKQREKEVKKKRGRIINYHPAFENTLLGIRLFQLDGLILSSHNSDLPKYNREYLLGNGEPTPDVKANIGGFQAFEDDFNNYLYRDAGLMQSFTSYVISNYKRHTLINVKDNKLILSGEPSYYFWKRNEPNYSLFLRGEKQEFSNTLDNEIKAYQKKTSDKDVKTWIISKIFDEIRTYTELIDDDEVFRNAILRNIDRDINAELSDEVIKILELLSTDDEIKQNIILNEHSTAELKSQLITLSTFNLSFKPIEVKELNNKVNQTAMVRSINPAVWDAGTVVMRYSAFFRYIKANYNKEWKIFMNQIKDIKTKPVITTPTVIKIENQESSQTVKIDSGKFKYDSIAKNIY